MAYSEDELRAVLTDNCVRFSEIGYGEVVRRGRRIRRRRWAAGLAATASVVLLASLVPGLVTWGGAADTGPVVRPRPAGEGLLPPTIKGIAPESPPGPIPLIHSEEHQTGGKRETVTYIPKSNFTNTLVRCADPDAWVITREQTPANGGETTGSVGRCTADGTGSGANMSSTGPNWIGKKQTLWIWVFPADTDLEGLDPENRIKRAQEGKSTKVDFAKTIRRIVKRAGTRTGPWAVGIYDKPVR